MSATLTIDLPRIYKKEQAREFDKGHREAEEIIRLQEFVAKGLIRPATKKIAWERPPKFAGKPLSEYVKEVKQ